MAATGMPITVKYGMIQRIAQLHVCASKLMGVGLVGRTLLTMAMYDRYSMVVLNIQWLELF